MWTMERREESGVGNGVDRERVGLIDDGRGMLVQQPKQMKHYST